MKNHQHPKFLPVFRSILLVFCLFQLRAASSQITSVTTVQHMSFGAFSSSNNGGTVTISNTGSRSVTGDVIALNLGIAYLQAIFEVEAVPGTIVSITNGPAAVLTGSNGGSMSMQIGNADPQSPFITTVAPPGRTQIKIGGTLTVGDAVASPAGSYSGTFFVTFNNE